MSSIKAPRTYVQTDEGLKDVGSLIEANFDNDYDCDLTPYEEEFVQDMITTYRERFGATNWLTINQTNLIVRIYNKIIKDSDGH